MTSRGAPSSAAMATGRNEALLERAWVVGGVEHQNVRSRPRPDRSSHAVRRGRQKARRGDPPAARVLREVGASPVLPPQARSSGPETSLFVDASTSREDD